MTIKILERGLVVAIVAAIAAGNPAMAQATDVATRTETTGTDRAFSYEMTTTASPEQVWALWTDVSTWKSWDRGLKDAELSAPMRRGAKGRIFPLAGPPASFTVTRFDPKRSYTFVTDLPQAKLTVRRAITGTSPTRFRHDVSFSGSMAEMFAKQLGPGFRKALPPTMRIIAALAEGSARDAQ